jgi:predicted MFS family arabinose efflux permease
LARRDRIEYRRPDAHAPAQEPMTTEPMASADAGAAAPASKPSGAAFSAGYRRWMMILLVAIYTSNFIDRTILPTLGQAIKQDLHLTDTQLGMLGGLTFAFFYSIFGIPLARVAERRSRVPLMAAAVTAWSMMTALCGLAQNFLQLAAARVGVGVGEASCMPCAHSLIADHYPPRQRASALAIFAFGIPLGSMIGAVAGGWIAQNMSWRLAFMIVGLPGLILALLTILTLKEPPRGHADGLAASGPAPPLTAVLKRYLDRPALLWTTAAATVAATATYGILNFVAVFFMRRFGLDIAHAGLATGAITGIGAGVSILAGGFLGDMAAKRDLRGYAWVAIAGLLTCLPLYDLGFTRGGTILALVLLVGAGVAQQLFLAPTFAVANLGVETRMRATSIALMSFVWSLIGQGLGPVFVGVMSDHMAKVLTADGASDILGLCRAAACADASATGLQYAMVSITVLYPISAALFWMASRHMRRDLA